jgi:hypothetical protein
MQVPFGLEDVDLTTISVVSVFRRQERTARSATIVVISRFGDDPEALPFPGLVGTQDAAAVPHGGVVEAAVFVVPLAPLAGDMTSEELTGRLPGSLEGFEGTRGGDNAPEIEQGILGSILAHVVSPVRDTLLLTVCSAVSDVMGAAITTAATPTVHHAAS